jgi:hypothetical protein
MNPSMEKERTKEKKNRGGSEMQTNVSPKAQ